MEFNVINANGIKVFSEDILFLLLFFGILSVYPYILHVEGRYDMKPSPSDVL